MSSKPRGMEGESLYDRRLVRSAVGGPKKPPAQHGLNRPAAKTARDHQMVCGVWDSTTYNERTCNKEAWSPPHGQLLALWERGDDYVPTFNEPPAEISPLLKAPPQTVSPHRQTSLEPPICASHMASTGMPPQRSFVTFVGDKPRTTVTSPTGARSETPARRTAPLGGRKHTQSGFFQGSHADLGDMRSEFSGSVGHNAYKYFSFEVISQQAPLTIQVEASDVHVSPNPEPHCIPQLYISTQHSQPTASKNQWHSATFEASNTVVIAAKEQAAGGPGAELADTEDPVLPPGRYYIAVHGVREGSFRVSVTTGEWKNGRPLSNVGKWTSPEGHAFAGQVLDGVPMEGSGAFLTSVLDDAGNEELLKFEGEWAEGKPLNGSGSVRLPDLGIKLEGEMRNACPWNATGEFTTDEGHRFKGEYQHGFPFAGFGDWLSAGLTCANVVKPGGLWSGEWKEGLPSSGSGVWVSHSSPTGDEGRVVHVKVNAITEGVGEGVITYTDGNMYKGGIVVLPGKVVLRSGKGKIEFKQAACETEPLGVSYDGQWVNDCFGGKGLMVFSNKDRYMGGWQKNRRHFAGTLMLADGAKFDGSWHMGVRCGEGIFTTADGVSTRLFYD